MICRTLRAGLTRRVRLIRTVSLYLTGALIFAALAGGILCRNTSAYTVGAENKYIKWVDFKLSETALSEALAVDVSSYGGGCHYGWIELLSYLALRNGGDFKSYKTGSAAALVEKLDGAPVESLVSEENRKLYDYYLEAYGAVLGGMVGTFYLDGEPKYGLKAYSPLARGFYYSDYDDFGAARTYGYRREHLGHDMMGSVGSPVIAVESGYIEALGWNMYGGWRIGIRSFDGKRYYYYAHLRKNHPYPAGLCEGDTVMAGDVIGYLGMTGYSSKENTNNIDTPHLHFGLQLIFDQSQKDGSNQIWIDVYALTKFLYKNRSGVYKDEDTGEYLRDTEFSDPSLPD